MRETKQDAFRRAVRGTRRWPWLAVAAMLATALPAQTTNSCVQCHPKESAAEAGQTHARASINCVDCHGGDASKPDKLAAKGPGTGYRGVLARAAVPQLCGDCHADVARMNQYGLPTDQLAQYRTSKHGEGLFSRHDDKVAVCSDCHGSHGILPAAAPASPVHPRNVPATCGKCHTDAALMTSHGHTATPSQEYPQSVHGVLLLVKGDNSAPQCATCHGHHGAAPPGFAAATQVCAKCHVQESEFFRRSPHQKIEDQSFNTCSVCHGSHEVRRAELGIYDTACKVCHAAADKGMAARGELLQILRTTADALDEAQRALDRALQQGTATADDQELLATAAAANRQLAPAQHALTPALLLPMAKETAEAVQRLQQRLQQATDDEHRRRLAVLPVVLFLALMSFGFWLRFRRIHALPRPTAG